TVSTGRAEGGAVGGGAGGRSVGRGCGPWRHISESIRERTGIATGTSFPRASTRRPLPPPSRRSRNLAPLLTKRLRRQAHGRGQGPQIDCARARAADAAMPDQPSQRNKPARQETSLYVPGKPFLGTLG